MSAQTIPYHLRPNKAVERNLFIALLGLINRVKNIANYAYIGFGGPFLEDFKNIHAAFGISNMLSLEMDENVHKRQIFNAPLKCIKYLPKTSDQFINNMEDYSIRTNIIVWLDYTSPSQLLSYLDEFQRLIAKSELFDIIKITLNADPTKWGKIDTRGKRGVDRVITIRRNNEERLTKLERRIPDEYFPQGLTPEMMGDELYPTVLCRIVELAAKRATQGISGRVFQPLSLFTYADRSTMQTITGILLPESDVENFFKNTGIKDWQFSCTQWGPPKLIDVPVLSLKERLSIEKLLPNTTYKDIYSLIDYIDEPEIDNYITYYRHYPFFSRVVL